MSDHTRYSSRRRSGPREPRRGPTLPAYLFILGLIAIVSVWSVTYTGVDTNAAVTQSQSDPTTTTTSGCASVYSDGQPAGPGYTFHCYSPSLGHGYNVP